MEIKNSISRRKFVSSVGLIGASRFFPLPASPVAETAVKHSGNIIKCGPYLQAAGPGRITIRWITHTLCYSWIEYGEDPDHLDKKALQVDDGLVQANNTVQGITLRDLRPGITYYYRPVSKNIDNFHPYKITDGETYTGQINTFSTPAPDMDKVEFLVFNDIHDRPESFPVLMAYQGESKKDFVFLNGDMFNWQDDEDQLVDHLLKPLCKLFAAQTPFIFSRGNHETRGKFARRIGDYFDGGEHKFYYSFQQGPLYAIVLDSGEDKEDDHEEYSGLVSFDSYRLEQRAWLENEIQKEAFRNARYKVVFSHIPLYYSGDWHGTLHCRKHWGPLLNKAKIDLLLSGHTHRYGIHPPVEGQHNYPIVIGGGKKDGTRTIINVKLDQDALNLEMFDDSGILVGTLNL